ncbi:hypothetical protein D5S17_01330 [Pseudonocardiaceae bacterium YIM PH 21723]|nr:hypothetical protein D5S17_01330 [Pseudonocardiaceae bacterium YIM PH 21723]
MHYGQAPLFPPANQGLPPRPASNKPTALQYVAWGLGLLAVMVVSGGLWLALSSGDAPSGTSPDKTSTELVADGFTFERGPEASDTDCAAHSYDKVVTFFKTTPCVKLDRALYTTTTADGRKVVTALAVVHLGSEAQVTQLKRLTDADSTGNVNDLLREGQRVSGGPASLGRNAAYKSAAKGSVLVIAESGYFDGKNDLESLRKVSEALVGAARV